MELLKKFRTWAIVIACVSIVLGVLLIVWPDISALAVCYVLGAVCVVAGIYALVRYFSLGPVGVFFRFDLAMGILGILAGILLLMHPWGALAILPVVVGFYIVVDSVFTVQTSVEMKHFGEEHWLLTMLLGIVSAALGFLMIVDPFDGASAIMIFMGVTLIFSGVESICAVAFVHEAVKEDEPIEAKIDSV